MTAARTGLRMAAGSHFFSERGGAKGGKSCEESSTDDAIAQLYVISATGGEAIPVTQGDEKIHSFAWSSDSSTLYFASRRPWTKAQKEAYEKEWKDVCQYRSGERGDQVFSVKLGRRHHTPGGCGQRTAGFRESLRRYTRRSRPRLNSMAHRSNRSFSGRTTPRVCDPVGFQRLERAEEFEIYTLDLNLASTRSAASPVDPQ